MKHLPVTSTQLRQLAPVKMQHYGAAKVFKFDVPDPRSNIGIEDCVLQEAAVYMLRVFEQELERQDLFEMYHMNREATYSSYLNLVTEQTLLHVLEDLDQVNVHEPYFDYKKQGMTYDVDDRLAYVRNNLHSLRPVMNVYAFNIMTRVVSPLLDMVHGIKYLGLRVDAFDFRYTNREHDTVIVKCYLSPEMGDVLK